MMTKKKLNKVSNSTRFGSCLQLNNNNSNNNDNNNNNNNNDNNNKLSSSCLSRKI